MRIDEFIYTDVLIIGAGLTGIRASISAAEKGSSVTVLSKGPAASPELMGFNAPVCPQDSEETYYKDVMRSGQYVNQSSIVSALVHNISSEVAYLRRLGLSFETNPDGSYHAVPTLGCTYPRLVHNNVGGMHSGKAAMSLLKAKAEQCGVRFLSGYMATDLIRTQDGIGGALAFNLQNGVCYGFCAKAVVLACGGGSGFYDFTTYPKGLCGDGYGMALRAGATLIDMEFQQFEPCCVVSPLKSRGLLAPTTLFLRGAQLTNGKSETIWDRYGLTPETMLKGDLALAMTLELRRGNGTKNGGLYYDATMLPQDMVSVEHNIFYEPLINTGIDLTKQVVEIAPAAHTCLGGVYIDANCHSDMPGLFAAGEAAGGLHGANRIGGCAGAETLVFGEIAGRCAAQYSHDTPTVGREKLAAAAGQIVSSLPRPGKEASSVFTEIPMQLGMLMNSCAGVIKTQKELEDAEQGVSRLMRRLSECGICSVSELAAYYSCQNMLQTAMAQIKAAQERRESRGVFSRSDFPNTDSSNELYNIIVKQYNGQMIVMRQSCNQKLK